MQVTQLQFLGGEDPLEEEMATHFSILVWEIPRAEDPGGLRSMESQRVRYNLVTRQKPPPPCKLVEKVKWNNIGEASRKIFGRK